MGKKYLMFIGENGFTDEDNNFYMVGVIFEENYCNGENNSLYSLRRIIEESNLAFSAGERNDDFYNSCILKNEWYNILKRLDFSVLVSKIKNENNDENYKISDKYSIAFNKLLKKYYCYVEDNCAENAGIVAESVRKADWNGKIQKFFELYMKRDELIKEENRCSHIINKFITAQINDQKYGYGFNVANVVKNFIKHYHERKNNKSEYKYGDRINEKVMNVIREKMFTGEIAVDISRKNSVKKSKELIKLENRIKLLQEENLYKERSINSKNLQINELLDEINVLHQQLDDIMLNKNTNIVFEILSDVDVKIKNIAES